MSRPNQPPAHGTWEFWIDVGGTFTDCIGLAPDGRLRVHKLLSSGRYSGHVAAESDAARLVDPARRADPPGFFVGWQATIHTPDGALEPAAILSFDPAEGALRLADGPAAAALACAPQRDGWTYDLDCDLEAPVIGVRWLTAALGGPGPVPLGSYVRLGTTRGTNALLERRGARTAFLTTRGFADILAIGDQTRPRLFALRIEKPAALHTWAGEVTERCGARGEVLQPLAEQEAAAVLAGWRAAGAESLAICLVNSHRNPQHERRLAELARAAGFAHVACSSELTPLQGFLARAETTVMDAYLAPVIRDYVARLQAQLPGARLALMTSSGGLSGAANFRARDSVLSGPAGGALGVARVATAAGLSNVLGFDMGGTSTDVCRYDGTFERRQVLLLEDRGAGGVVRIMAPMLEIETVAAGGGSICDFDGIKPVVGPRSAGADPGPACYGRGGPLCVTDLNVYLGRLPPETLPLPADRAAVAVGLENLANRIAAATGRRYEPTDLALGLLNIANQHMATAIRRVSLQRGHDPREFALVSFGGAGGQHACAVAELLGIRRILQPALAGVLSAYGIGLAPIRAFAVRDIGARLDAGFVAERLPVIRAELADEALRKMAAEGCRPADVTLQVSLELRYEGQEAALTTPAPSGGTDGDWRSAFEAAHQRLYGFVYPERAVEVFSARLEAASHERPAPASAAMQAQVAEPADAAAPGGRRQAAAEGHSTTLPRIGREAMPVGVVQHGPLLILDPFSTLFVEPGWQAVRLIDGAVRLDHDPSTAASAAPAAHPSQSIDPVTLELFSHRFTAVAEEMGAVLQRTALSTNVKDRLDFSCAICDAAGELVSHAPHVPVHIGAMAMCVQCLLEDIGPDGLRPGEVIVTNDPYRGGSHLPDVTVITPVFAPTNGTAPAAEPAPADSAPADPAPADPAPADPAPADPATAQRPVFFVVNRAHHAEIGGIEPGSMPAGSRRLVEEGVLIAPRRLRPRADGNAAADDAELRALLSGGPYPSRSVAQNLADLRAQIAANHRGRAALETLLGREGTDSVVRYAAALQDAAARMLRAALRRLPPGRRTFRDQLDDGARLQVALAREDGPEGPGVVVDFTGTAPPLPGNLNATPAIVTSAVVYAFRCLLDDPIPLNGGVLRPLRIVLPTCLLNPPADGPPEDRAAVVGGNVETSQRIVDVLFGALGVVAAGQGTMNNFAFGNEDFGYYETIGGGSGAGPGFRGADAVHVHMTNTRLTDVEVLESRFPVRVRAFAVRRGSGGAGRWRGGDGLVRAVEFLAPLSVSLLTQRRTCAPFGLDGGSPGAAGRNRLERAAGFLPDLPGCVRIAVQPGDVLWLETPGGGGYGPTVDEAALAEPAVNEAVVDGAAVGEAAVKESSVHEPTVHESSGARRGA